MQRALSGADSQHWPSEWKTSGANVAQQLQRCHQVAGRQVPRTKRTRVLSSNRLTPALVDKSPQYLPSANTATTPASGQATGPACCRQSGGVRQQLCLTGARCEAPAPAAPYPPGPVLGGLGSGQRQAQSASQCDRVARGWASRLSAAAPRSRSSARCAGRDHVGPVRIGALARPIRKTERVTQVSPRQLSPRESARQLATSTPARRDPTQREFACRRAGPRVGLSRAPMRLSTGQKPHLVNCTFESPRPGVLNDRCNSSWKGLSRAGFLAPKRVGDPAELVPWLEERHHKANGCRVGHVHSANSSIGAHAALIPLARGVAEFADRQHHRHFHQYTHHAG